MAALNVDHVGMALRFGIIFLILLLCTKRHSQLSLTGKTSILRFVLHVLAALALALIWLIVADNETWIVLTKGPQAMPAAVLFAALRNLLYIAGQTMLLSAWLSAFYCFFRRMYAAVLLVLPWVGIQVTGWGYSVPALFVLTGTTMAALVLLLIATYRKR